MKKKKKKFVKRKVAGKVSPKKKESPPNTFIPGVSYIRARVARRCPKCQERLGFELRCYGATGGEMECIRCRYRIPLEENECSTLRKKLYNELKKVLVCK